MLGSLQRCELPSVFLRYFCDKKRAVYDKHFDLCFSPVTLIGTHFYKSV